MSLVVLDITGGGNGIPIASRVLFERSLTNTQGVTDVGNAGEDHLLLGEGAEIGLELNRGRTYRIAFQLRSYSELFLVGSALSGGAAHWHFLEVALADDEVEQIEGVRLQVAQLQQEVEAIQMQLDQIEGMMAEIRALLLLPPGQRPGFNDPPPGHQDSVVTSRR